MRPLLLDLFCCEGGAATGYVRVRHQHAHRVEHPDLLTPTLALLRERYAEVPWVVENVEATCKLPGALMLCGAAFGLGTTCRDGIWRPLRRHRLFESNVPLMGPGCACSGRQPVGVYGHGGGGGMTRGYKGDLAESRAAMDMPWASREGVSQAIPPVYTEHIGAQLLDHLRANAA